ncbi:exodeoxyribonuclease 7 large subunit [Portibacter lacus]|uniref:Exodeoxyribonuclease VII large subunit n=1 Tax=Portibacter lacus TaxID=1099794 RepID=A0AA37WDT7_9BACT|nr:exodeoxyribonuclease 7 large subunit [Portibacter lacus]
MDLIQKEEHSDTIKAQASAIIWFKKAAFLEKKFKSLFKSILDTGNEVRVKVSISFSERYGFSLLIEDLDASYTLGKAEMVKQEILNKLKAENLLYVNAEIPLPAVLQNIAVISSETAAGYKDFLSHLRTNSYGYHYNITLYQAAMQGQAVENEVIASLDQIEREGGYDCVVIIRGGGAKLDLSAFDNYNLAKRIAKCSLPVITGIGHDIDQSIADIVSHTDLKTPTAVADFLIETTLHFESRLIDIGQQIQITYKDILQAENNKLVLIYEQLKNSFSFRKQLEQNKLNELDLKLKHGSTLNLKSMKDLLVSFESQIDLLAPDKILQRGFAIVRQNGKVVKDVKKLDSNKEIETEFINGKIKSKII